MLQTGSRKYVEHVLTLDELLVIGGIQRVPFTGQQASYVSRIVQKNSM